MQTSPSPSPIKRILVATDFSPTARAALDRAMHIATLHGASLHLLHAVETFEVPMNVPLETQRLVTAEVEAQLAELERIVGQAGIEVESEHQVGKAWQVIGDAVERTPIDLVALGTRGHNAYSRMLLGSTADRVIRRCTVPVLTVHPEDAARPAIIRSILVATDFSEESVLAARLAARLLEAQGEPGTMVLLHVCHAPMVYETEAVATVIAQQVADDLANARRELEALAGSLGGDQLQVSVVAEEGYPVTVIEQEARRIGADLIALGTHGRSGISHLLMGSIAERVVHHAPCPVLTVRHPEVAEVAQRSA